MSNYGKNVSISKAHKNKKIQFKYSKNVITEPDNPEKPSLPEANVNLDTIEAMVNTDLKEGDVVRTKVWKYSKKSEFINSVL